MFPFIAILIEKHINIWSQNIKYMTMNNYKYMSKWQSKQKNNYN